MFRGTVNSLNNFNIQEGKSSKWNQKLDESVGSVSVDDYEQLVLYHQLRWLYVQECPATFN